MKQLEKLLKVLADKNRLRIVWLLRSRKMCVCELAHIIGITQPSVSKHIKKLTDAGLVLGEQDRFWTNYYLKGGNRVFDKLIGCLSGSLSEDAVVRGDSKKLRTLNRESICCRKIEK